MIKVTIRYGREFAVGASKEVVVACGTVASPKLLLLSGIGPATHLNQVFQLRAVGHSFTFLSL